MKNTVAVLDIADAQPCRVAAIRRRIARLIPEGVTRTPRERIRSETRPAANPALRDIHARIGRLLSR